MEVRCCCEPARLLGTIAVPDYYADCGHINVAVAVKRTMGKIIRHPFVRFEVAKVTDRVVFSDEFLQCAEPEQICELRRMATRKALKKPHDVTMEDLRMLTGFTEAK